MNHNPSNDSPNIYPSAQAVVAPESYQVNSLLQQALGCLDIKLEDELARFRSKQEEQSSCLQENVEIVEQQSGDLDFDAEIFTAEIIQPVRSNTIEKGDQFSRGEAEPTSGFIVIDGLSSSTSQSRNAITTVGYAPISVYQEDGSQVHDNLNLNFSSGGEIASFHDEYLSSSQELLRQIQSGYPAADGSGNRTQSVVIPKNKHFTPLKIGSMAVACVLAGGAAYTALNPSILAPLTATKVVSPAIATTSSLGQLIQSPNLAANEFTELNLSTLNTIKLPTATTATNVSAATSTIGMPTTTVSTAPAAIPFNGVGSGSQIIPPVTINSQPRLADSLVKSLLPANFHSFAKPASYRAIQPGLGR
jgi:hypothetical protein